MADEPSSMPGYAPLITPPKFGEWYRPATRHVRRIKRVAIVIFIASFILFTIAAAGLQFALGWSSGISEVDRVVRSAVALLVGMASVHLHAWSARRRLLHLRWQVCPSCLYSVEGLEDSNWCPECGRAFSTELLRQDFAAYSTFLSHFLPWKWFAPRGACRPDR